MSDSGRAERGRWAPGHSGNPGGRPPRRSVPALIRKLAREQGTDRELAAAILGGLRSGYVELPHPLDLPAGTPRGYVLEDLADWRSLLAYTWAPARPDEEGEGDQGERLDLVAEAQRRGLLTAAGGGD